MRNTFHRLPRSAFEPLRIEARLQCPVIADEYLPIDSILYYQAMRERYGEQEITYSGGEHPNAVAGVQLPLARCEEHGPMWYYAASFAQWTGQVATGQDHWNHRLDTSLAELIDWQGRKARVEIASGRYKSYHMPIYYRHCLAVEWYVLGHQASVEALLARVTHLGKKISQGWGSVGRWSVNPIPEDWSVRRDGRLVRAIPSSDARGGVFTGFRPSYWLPKNQARCFGPEPV